MSNTHVPTSPARRLLQRGAILILLVCLLGALTSGAKAANIATSFAPTDTTVSRDGTMSFVLVTGNSTLLVIDPATHLVIATINLGVPVNTALDADWSEPLQKVLIGCSNGLLISVDPWMLTVLTLINNPLANYRIICADNLGLGTDGWAIDTNTNTIHQFLAGGVWVNVAPTPVGTPVELVEKPVNASLPTPWDGYLLVAGTSGAGLANAMAFDRTTMLASPLATWTVGTRAVTGFTCSEAGDAYLSCANGGVGDVLHLSLATLAFTTAPLATFGTGVPVDVSMAGPFLSVALALAAGPGTEIHVYDAGDPANVLYAGFALVDPANTAAGGLSAWVRASGSFDDVYTVYANTTASAGSDWTAEHEATWNHPTSPTVGTWVYPDTTPGAPGYPPQSHLPCTDCPPQETGRGLLEGPFPFAATDFSVQFASGEEVKTVPIVRMPSVGIDMEVYLTYRSRRSFDGRYGQSWFLNHDVKLETEANGDLTYHNGYGRLDAYVSQGGGVFTPPVHYDTALSVVGNQTFITDRFGTTATYDSQGRRTALQDRYGNQMGFGWTGDRLDTVTDTLGRTTTLNYGSDGRLSSLVDSTSRTWTFTYDYLGQLRSVTTPSTSAFPAGRRYRFSYGSNSATPAFVGNLVHAWSPMGEVVQTLRYDTNDMVYREEIGGDPYQIAYDLSTTKTTVTDRSENIVEWTFGSYAMVTRVEAFTKGLRTGEPTSYVTTFSVNATTGLIDHVVYPRGNRVDYSYDTAKNLTQVRRRTQDTSTNDASDIVESWQYGAYGQPSSHTDPQGRTTSFTLDGYGSTTQVTHPTVTSPSNQSVVETFTYDSLGRMLTATDGANRVVQFTYFTSGVQTGYLQSVIRDPTGLALTTTFSHDAYGNITSVQDPNGATTQITVDAENFVTEIQAPSPLSYRRKVTYDEDRRVTKVEVENRDKDGTLDASWPWIDTRFEYDRVGRLLTKKTRTYDGGPVAKTSYAYDGSGALVQVTSPENEVDTFAWDERHLLFQATRGYGTADAATVQFDYDPNGNLEVLTDARSATTVHAHDLFDRRVQTTNALGAYVTLQYDKSGNVTQVDVYDAQAAIQARTTNYFDEIDRLWKVVRTRTGPGLTTTTPTTIFTRDAGHLLTQILDPMSNTTSFGHDTAGRRISVTDAAGDVRALTLDANGNATKISDTEVPASGPSETFETEFDYDVLNRLVERREIDRLNSQNVLTTQYAYDSRNNLVFRVDAEGAPARWTYDLASRLTKYERALQVGAQIETFLQSIDEVFQYDEDDRLTAVTDDNFSSTLYAYDALSRRTRTTYADSKFVDYTWDANSNLSGWSDQNGTSVTNTHDALNRLTSRSVTRGTGVLGTTAESYSYDALNRMLTAVDDDYQVEFQYDSVGNPLTDKQGYTPQGQEIWKTVTTSWTDAGSVAGVTYPSAFQVAHTRDSIYRMTAMQDVAAATNIATFTWQGAGRLATTSNQNGTGTAYTWDGFRRIQEIDHTLPTAQTLHKFEYLYDKVHNRRMEKNSFDATWMGTLPAQVQAFLGGRSGKGDVYAYDMAYRLIDVRYDVTNPQAEVQNPGTQAFARLVQYTIDGLGNRSQVQTTPPTPPTQVLYSTDVVNQYTTVGGTTRTHDNNGNLADDGTQLYAYDFQNRLVQVTNKSTQQVIASYRYDALGRRVEKAVNGGATTRYILHGVQVVEEFDGSNVWQARYVYEDGIDQPRSMDRADQADVNGNQNTTEVLRFHYHQQALGCVTEMTQPTGAVVEWVTYDVYGLPSIRDMNGNVITQSAVGNPYLYTGREYDPESGLYFYRARQYDPSTGRFVQRDPLEYIDGLSLYAYAYCAPATATDPLGEHGGGSAQLPGGPRGGPPGRDGIGVEGGGAPPPVDAEGRAKIEAAAKRAADLEKKAADLVELAKKDAMCKRKDYNRDGSAGGDDWENKPKCNLYVADLLVRAGFPLPVVLLPVLGGFKQRIPTAAEWAGDGDDGAAVFGDEDPDERPVSLKSPQYEVVGEPRPGDIASVDGHVGIVTEVVRDESGKVIEGKTVSATTGKGVVEGDWGFREGQKTVFRRLK